MPRELGYLCPFSPIDAPMNSSAVRGPRIKIPSEQGESAYHCITRTVNKEHLFDDVAKEVLRRQLWQVADYCGVQVVTYSVLVNHFHVLVRVPQKAFINDAELLRRYHVLYPKTSAYQIARIEVIQKDLAADGDEAAAWRQRQVALMGDISQFMKLLKQRFSIWFNKTYRRVGTLWSERFKSVLVEVKERVLQSMAAYIDLNCVRAGLTADPKEYRFCGYAEAIAGNTRAQEGLRSITAAPEWSAAQVHYREVIFGTGAGAREHAAVVPVEAYKQVLAEGGNLQFSTILRCRIRYFTDGAILGTREFVDAQLEHYRRKTGACPRTEARSLAAGIDWGDLRTMRALRREALG